MEANSISIDKLSSLSGLFIQPFNVLLMVVFYSTKWLGRKVTYVVQNVHSMCRMLAGWYQGNKEEKSCFNIMDDANADINASMQHMT